MMKDNSISLQIKLDELQQVIQYLSTSPNVEIERGYPSYSPEVCKALDALGVDPNYDFDAISDIPIKNMDLGQIRNMLTFIRRGERFCDGHIVGYVESGELLQLMERILEIVSRN